MTGLQPPPKAFALALGYLRRHRGMARRTLAFALGIKDRQLARMESGEQKMNRDGLLAAIAPLAHPPEAAEALLFTHRVVAGASESAADEDSPLTPSQACRQRVSRASLAAGWAVAEATQVALTLREKQRMAAADRQEAEALCERLKRASPQERKDMVATFPEYRSWAVAVALSRASERAAAHGAKLALDLARLGVDIASQLKGAGRFRARLLGYCWAYLGNAFRVANDFAAADAAFGRAWDNWNSGGDPDHLLEEWRLFDLEASLRREQRRFEDALERLDRASEIAHCSNETSGRLLLKKEHVYEQMGDIAMAVSVLAEATCLLRGSTDDRLVFTVRYNTAADLCQLERHREADALLPQVRELAEQLRNELDLLRVVWLEAEIANGLGRREHAVALLEQVRREFTARYLPYDAALSSLDLCVLFLEEGQTPKVRELALAMTWIFSAQGIEREALAALALFCQAASSDTATVELARAVIAEIEGARSTRS